MSVVDAIYQRMSDDTEQVLAGPTDESEVAKFYAGLSVLVTGPTDLLGKCLVEKLLRSCPDIQRIYLLVRVRKNYDYQDNCRKLFADPVFDKLRESGVDIKSKLQPIKGDLMEERLGLNDEDYSSVIANTNVIIHNGATSHLSEAVRVALRTNVYGTKSMLELGRACKKLKIFALVSSAYSQSQERMIEERFYRSPADLKTVDDMIAADTNAREGLSPSALRMLLGDWPNVYAFSKAAAEDLVRQYADRVNFACCVFRPSLVVSAWKEPMRGYCDNKNAPANFFVKLALGAVHVVYNVDYPCDLVPADMTANALIVCVWDALDRWQIEPEAFVYNFGTSQEKPVTMRQIKEKVMNEPNALASSSSRRLPYVIFATNFVVYFALRIILDYIPAVVIDVITVLHQEPPTAWSLVRESMGDMCRLRRFSLGNWRVRVDECLKAYERLNARDRELFDCDVRQLDWDDYFLTYWRGVRRHVLRESLDSVDEPVSKCPCKCRRRCCKPGCYILLGLILLVVYYLVRAIF